MNHSTLNTTSIGEFSRFITEQKASMKKQYDQLLAHDLSHQQWDGCFQRNILIVLEKTYADAMTQLQTLPFDHTGSTVNQGLVDLTKAVLAVFDGFIDEFLLTVVDKHRTSCALSNFPDEHKPDQVYLSAVRSDIALIWRNFALDINAYFLERR
ncbi:amine oxidase [Methylomonas fluvii]|uniref:Amine oxidase n=1 Tax=Methylomonas fluvii TaxID=1854564 RepID=A0ABR9DJ96_9GAMM|nr:amine oxidase [Methylomonas fluvii]MBD9363125.1 amine oxidase [Methylomonas fluvii]CAD6876368.1 amine oxidase [Methylomonas fluvii]